MDYSILTHLIGPEADSLLSMVGMLFTATAVLVVYRTMLVRAPMLKRLRALALRREQLKAELEAPKAKRRSRITQHSATSLRVQDIMARLKMLQDKQLSAAETKLLHAGIRSKDWAVAIILGRAILPIALGSVTFSLIYISNIWPEISDLKRFMYTAGSIILSYKAPDLFVQNKITKRVEAIRKGLPDALDLLIICAEAGLTVDAAFSRVSRELGRAYPELADEMWLTSIELGFLTERRLAYQNLANRIPLESIRGVATMLIQTEKYGTPVAAALRVLTAEFRNERMMAAEAKAARLPALMTVPMIFFTLPPLFIVIMGPGACVMVDAMAKM